MLTHFRRIKSISKMLIINKPKTKPNQNVNVHCGVCQTSTNIKRGIKVNKGVFYLKDPFLICVKIKILFRVKLKVNNLFVIIVVICSYGRSLRNIETHN